MEENKTAVAAMNYIPSKYMANFDTPKSQEFSLPAPLMRYMINNPTGKFYAKIVGTCKYFYSIKRVFHFAVLNFVKNNDWTVCTNFDCPKRHDFELFKIPVKIWLAKGLQIDEKASLFPNLASSLVSKLYRCDINQLILYSQKLTIKEFLFLTKNVDCFIFDNGYITEQDGTVLKLEKIIEYLPKLKSLS
uniref:Uncharacterized protein n=1 Tax=Panagrolaimus sp. ES5 TaxID=591445 RepID=A0AC34FQ98_9BILA